MKQTKPRCPRKKCGEYNLLRCCDDEGHKGECCFVVDHENDYPRNKKPFRPLTTNSQTKGTNP